MFDKPLSLPQTTKSGEVIVPSPVQQPVIAIANYRYYKTKNMTPEELHEYETKKITDESSPFFGLTQDVADYNIKVQEELAEEDRKWRKKNPSPYNDEDYVPPVHTLFLPEVKRVEDDDDDGSTPANIIYWKELNNKSTNTNKENKTK